MFGLEALLGIGGKLIDKLSSQRLFRSFARSKPKINGVIGQSGFFTPLRYRQRFSKGGNETSVSSVFCLFFSISPFTIIRAVSFVIINSLNAKIIWPFSHIAQKINKVKPTVTNCYAPSPVIFVRFAFWTCASFFKSFPYLIRRGSFAS